MISSRCALFTLAATLGGCAGPVSAPVTAREPRAAAAEAPRGGPLRVVARAARALPFGATALGLDEEIVTVTVTNEGDAPIRVGELRLAFDVRREGVSFACKPQSPTRDFEAGTLRPGESFTADTPLRCWTPLAGRYDARAIVLLSGQGQTAISPFDFEILDRGRNALQPYEARAGLYVLAGGALRTHPVPDSLPDEHGYRAVLVLANASARPMTLPPARVTLDVFRAGDSLPCTSQVSLHPLGTLAPGAVEVERVPVTCLRERRGLYEVRASVAFDDERAVEAGRFEVRVTDDLGTIIPAF